MMGKDSERLSCNRACRQRFLPGRKYGIKKRSEVRINEVRWV